MPDKQNENKFMAMLERRGIVRKADSEDTPEEAETGSAQLRPEAELRSLLEAQKGEPSKVTPAARQPVPGLFDPVMPGEHKADPDSDKPKTAVQSGFEPSLPHGTRIEQKPPGSWEAHIPNEPQEPAMERIPREQQKPEGPSRPPLFFSRTDPLKSETSKAEETAAAPSGTSPVEKKVEASHTETPEGAPSITKTAETTPFKRSIDAPPFGRPAVEPPADRSAERSIEQPAAAPPVDRAAERPDEQSAAAPPVDRTTETPYYRRPMDTPVFEQPAQAPSFGRPVEPAVYGRTPEPPAAADHADRYLDIDELFEVLSLKTRRTDTVYLIEEYLKSLPDSLPDESRREIVRKIVTASGFDFDLLMGDGVLRVKMLKEYAEKFARYTDEYVAARNAELAEIEQQSLSIRKLIETRRELHKKQFFAIETEAQRLKEILTFISG